MKSWWLRIRHLINYGIFGVMTTLVHIGIFYIARIYGQQSITTSYVVAWVIAVGFAYITNRQWVFKPQAGGIGDFWQAMGRFYIGRIVTGVIGWGILTFGVQVLHGSDQLWNVIQNIIVIISNYWIAKWLIFKRRGKL